MADLKKIRLSGVTYNIVDESALHQLDNTVTSSGTNAVKGSGIYDAITASTAAALQTVAEAGYQTSSDVQNAISGKAEASDVETLSGTVTAHTANTDIHVTTAQTAAWNAKADISDIPSVTGYADAVDYDSNAKEVKFYHGGTGGTEVYSFDASPFLIDGMIESVVITSVTSGGSEVQVLEITWNSAAGGQVTDIPLTDIFDASNYYTTAQTNNAIEAAVSGKTDTSAFTAYTSATDTALAGKQATLVSGTNIKTINNKSLLGSGNIEIEQGTVDQTIISGSTNAVAGGAVYDGLAGKQATLVSGTNIKTVGTNSVLGSGNIALMTASVGTGNDSETLIFDFA